MWQIILRENKVKTDILKASHAFLFSTGQKEITLVWSAFLLLNVVLLSFCEQEQR